MFRTARWGGIALGIVGCAAGGAQGATFTNPAPVKEVVACLTAVLDSANYSVERVDRRKGSVLGSQPSKDVAPTTDPREYRRLDKLEFDAGKGGVWTYRAYGIKQYGSVAGNQEDLVEASDSAAADADRFAKRCAR